MKNKIKDFVTNTCTLILAFVFIYTAVSKVYDWEGTWDSLYNQVFPIWFADILFFALPVLEIGIAGLLVSSKWEKMGLWLSGILMVLFTGYVGLIYIGFFDRVPCSCGGVISSFSWGQHLLFNLFLLGVVGVGLKLKEEGRWRKDEIKKREKGKGKRKKGKGERGKV
ncbi:MauE/DoxX family redox-associated membrane protein [Belliella aquatica]|uniref:Methylamine utilisation protein MauE domain-containing protein n=1 Tax=Belliella aquatica TaxID=1323734 RepID=A0ABQ1N446_9BACT|nr:MauE/DoxX family redox-associated membrane protein [Belliella aquatica]MCH7407426.1 hypothetical protein [Belliella aquatica]GGC53042.1 hypothetical protein GCM10010993_34340 [Belliella aquatica]